MDPNQIVLQFAQGKAIRTGSDRWAAATKRASGAIRCATRAIERERSFGGQLLMEVQTAEQKIKSVEPPFVREPA